MPTAAIPVIDISGLQSDHLPDRQAVAAELRHACHTVGFFYIKNHGVSQGAIAEILAQTQRFFHQPLALKNQVASTNPHLPRGYEPLASQVLDTTKQADLKESYLIGVELEQTHPLVQQGLPNHGPNTWPTQFPGWREALESYFATLVPLAHRLGRGLALSLELPEDFFEPFTNQPMAILRLLHYPPHPLQARADDVGCGTHTDWGFLTILLQDDVAGLEVCTAQGEWVLAEPIPDTFVINLGDMTARWTNDYYQSTPHRVINRSGRDRYAIPFFWDLNYHARVECLPTCHGPDNPRKYPPITAGEHIIEMYRKTYGQPQPELTDP
jgi:isopenicillin N synthase-like dioxygenase